MLSASVHVWRESSTLCISECECVCCVKGLLVEKVSSDASWMMWWDVISSATPLRKAAARGWNLLRKIVGVANELLHGTNIQTVLNLMSRLEEYKYRSEKWRKIWPWDKRAFWNTVLKRWLRTSAGHSHVNEISATIIHFCLYLRVKWYGGD